MKNLKKVRGHKLIKKPEAEIPGDLKANLEEQAQQLIETTLKPAFINSIPEETTNSSYITGIYGKWEDHYFYFCAQYRHAGSNAGPNAGTSTSSASTTEFQFARLDYIGDVRFNLSYKSHLGKWEKIFIDLTVAECMEAIKNESFFYPLPQ